MVYTKCKEFEIGHYITIIIDKKKISFDLNFDSETIKVPDFITFLLIIDFQFPTNPPRILSKTNVLLSLKLVLLPKFNGWERPHGRNLFLVGKNNFT